MAMMNFMDIYRRNKEPEIPGKPEEIPLEKLYGGIGPALGSQQAKLQLPVEQAQAQVAQPASEAASPGAVAGIQAGAQLLGSLMKSASERESALQLAKQKAMQQETEAEMSSLSQAQGSKQNALSRLIASYKSALF